MRQNRDAIIRGVPDHYPAGSVAPPLDRTQKLLLLAVLFITFLSLSASLRFGWVYDDHPQIENNPHLHWHEVGSYFTKPLWHWIPEAAQRFYRPLLLLWFLVLKSLFGMDPHRFHLMSVLAHVAVTRLVFLFARNVFKSNPAALFAAAIFGLHPMHVETAAWISDANDLLAALGLLGSLLLLQRGWRAESRGWQWFVAAAACLGAALLAKEISVVFPALVALQICFERRDGASRGRRVENAALAGSAAFVGLFLVLRQMVLPHLENPPLQQDAASTLWSVPALLLFYLKKTFWPAGLAVHYDFAGITNPMSAGFLLPLPVLFAIAAMVVLEFRKGGENRSLMVAAGWFLLPLAPALNLHWTYMGDPLHDRYSYLSGVGVAIFGGWLWMQGSRVVKVDRWRAVIAGAMVLCLASATYIQTWTWSSDAALFKHAVEIAPRNAWAHWNWGSSLAGAGRWQEAEAQFADSYRIQATWRAAHYAGFAALASGDAQSAESWLNTAVQYRPVNAESWFQLGMAREKLGKPALAEENFRTALQSRPDGDGWHYALGLALEQQGKKAEALQEFRTELKLHPAKAGVKEKIAALTQGS